MSDYDNTNKGTLGKNERREKDSHPEYTGKLNVDGKDYWLSAWVKESAKGKFFSLSVKPKEDSGQRAPSKPAPPQNDFDDSDIPF